MRITIEKEKLIWVSRCTVLKILTCVNLYNSWIQIFINIGTYNNCVSKQIFWTVRNNIRPKKFSGKNTENASNMKMLCWWTFRTRKCINYTILNEKSLITELTIAFGSWKSTIHFARWFYGCNKIQVLVFVEKKN